MFDDFHINGESLVNAIGGLVNSAGSIWSNIQGRKSARHAQNRQFKFAREQTEKMIELANTAHRREVADLRAAGLNPILSAGGNGAATPSLPTLSAEGFTPSNPMSGIASSAREIARYVSDEYKSGVDNTVANTELQQQEKLNRAGELTHLKNVDDYMDAQHRASEGAVTAEYLRNQVDKVATQRELGLTVDFDRNGVWSPKVFDPGAFNSAVNLAQEGVRSAMKVKANENARAWMSSIDNMVNSAANAVNTLNPKKWLSPKRGRK